ncbi:MAG: hypothetical protein AAF639_28895 [Chloroflexota bacterium]
MTQARVNLSIAAAKIARWRWVYKLAPLVLLAATAWFISVYEWELIGANTYLPETGILVIEALLALFLFRRASANDALADQLAKETETLYVQYGYLAEEHERLKGELTRVQTQLDAITL